MLTRNAEARPQTAARAAKRAALRAGNGGGTSRPAGRSFAGGEAEGVLSLVILGDDSDVIAAGAHQFLFGLQVL